MNLSIQERLILLSVLPRQGDVTTLRIVRDLEAELSFSEEEHAALQLKQDGNRVTWTAEKNDYTKEVPIGPKVHSLIAGALEALNKDEKLGLEHLPLYERFCEEKQDEVSVRRRK